MENEDGLRYPALTFSNEEPPLYSARIAPQIVGIGLLEAIDESDILDWEDPTDSDGNGISGVANRIPDPVTGDIRLGRLGWKASTISVEHQTAAALNGDMGVMTSILPSPDCGVNKKDVAMNLALNYLMRDSIHWFDMFHYLGFARGET